MDETVYFVWEMLNGRAWPTKWYGNKVSAATGKEASATQKYLLKENERNLTFDELAQKYPFKKEPKT